MRIKRKILFLTVILSIVSAFLLPQKAFASCPLAAVINGHEEYTLCTGRDLAQVDDGIAGFVYDRANAEIVLDGFHGTIGFTCYQACGTDREPIPPSIKVVGESTVNGIIIKPYKNAIALELKITNAFDFNYEIGGTSEMISLITVLDEEIDTTETEANTEKTEIAPIADAQESLCTEEATFSRKNVILGLCILFISIQLLLIVGYIIYRAIKRGKHKDVSSPDADASGRGFPDWKN